jgi:signal transduction histidine kinase
MSSAWSNPPRTEEKIEILRRFEVLAGFSDEEMAEIAGLCWEKAYAEGDVIFVEDEPAKELFLVLEGKVSLEKRVRLGRSGSSRQATVSVVGPHMVAGWSSIIAPYRYTSTAVCLQPSRALALNGRKVRQFISSHPVSGLAFMDVIAGTISSRLRNATTTLTSFLSVISHEIKSPLAAVENYLQVMLGGFAGEVTDKQRRMLERSILRVSDLRGLISDALDLARMRPEHLQADFEWLDPAEAATQAVEDVRLAASQKQVKLQIDVPPNLPQIVAARRRLRQLFSNLLSNAVKFSPEGGVVTLTARDEPERLIVEVLDEGPGIPADEQRFVFEDFYRGRNAGSVAGSGLGLSIVKKIVEAHHGEVKIESPYASGKPGARFTVVIPRNLTTADMNRQGWAAREEET